MLCDVPNSNYIDFNPLTTQQLSQLKAADGRLAMWRVGEHQIEVVHGSDGVWWYDPASEPTPIPAIYNYKKGK